MAALVVDEEEADDDDDGMVGVVDFFWLSAGADGVMIFLLLLFRLELSVVIVESSHGEFIMALVDMLDDEAF